jgi:hypothetical protein
MNIVIRYESKYDIFKTVILEMLKGSVDVLQAQCNLERRHI